MEKNYIEFLFNYINKFFKFIGPLFSIIINTFLIYTYFSLLKNVFPYWYVYYYPYESRKIFYNLYKSIMTIELCYTLFNNILALLVKPGNIKDIRNSKYYKTHSPYFSERLLFPISSVDMSKNSINDIEKGLQLKSDNITHKNTNWSICKICNEIKPLRTHHCSICGSCVFKMDHHCPWINNCIGQNNHRYFLLFLVHVFLYSIFSTVIILLILFNKKKLINIHNDVNIMQKEPNIIEIKYLGFLGLSCIVIELLFSGWNWFLVLNGNTTLEFWSKRTGYELFKGIQDYSFGTWKKNLFYVFGSTNLIKIIFIPSFKKLPFSGLEISKFIDPEFSIEGIN